jgi:hypothetical protein
LSVNLKKMNKIFIPSGFDSLRYYHFDGEGISINDVLAERLISLEEDVGSLVTTLSESELKQVFNDQDKIGHTSWTAWSNNWAYFPMYNRWSICWVGFAPRNPCGYESPANDGSGI